MQKLSLYSIIVLLGIAAGGAVLMTIYNPFNSSGHASPAQLNLPANGALVTSSRSTSVSSTTTNSSTSSVLTTTSSTNSTGLLSNPPPSSGGGSDDGSQTSATHTRTGDD